MKTLITIFSLMLLVSCQDKKLEWQGAGKPDTLVIQTVDIKVMPLESDTITF